MNQELFLALLRITKKRIDANGKLIKEAKELVAEHLEEIKSEWEEKTTLQQIPFWVLEVHPIQTKKRPNVPNRTTSKG